MSKGYQSGFFSSFLRGSDFYKSLGLIPITVSRLTKVKIKKPASVAVPSLLPECILFLNILGFHTNEFLAFKSTP